MKRNQGKRLAAAGLLCAVLLGPWYGIGISFAIVFRKTKKLVPTLFAEVCGAEKSL